ncbi:MAG: molybdenum ABC transporter ATP-binding protein [Acidobacteriia bacterium]|nr:molybdenum ABC transporter ATP-binding protein [Terriglobia bacterium]
MIDRNGAALSIQVSKRLASNGRHRFSLNVDVSLPAGITILFGPSGSGKTTVLQCIAGLTTPDAGRIAAGDTVLFDSHEGIDVDVSQRSIGYVFQELALFPHLTVEQNVQYGLGKLDAQAKRERTLAILDSFHVAHLLHAYPRDISGGERQRVALARSLVTMPRVLLLDEPLSGLDVTTKNRIIEDLRAWNEARRIPILYVTHSRREVFALGERVVCLENGEILAQGAPHEVLNQPQHETIAQLAGFENVFDATVLALHETQGTMTCRLEDSQVEVEIPLARVEAGARVRLAVRAGDILLATQPPLFLSARNVVPGKLARLERAEGLVVTAVDCSGVKITVNVTPGACETLKLEPGKEIWLVIKTHSCHLVESRANAGVQKGAGNKRWIDGAHAAKAERGDPRPVAAAARSFPRLKVLYLLGVTALAFAVPAWSVTRAHRWQFLPALLALQVLLLLQARVSAGEIARGATRLKWLFLFLLLMYTFLPSDSGGNDEIIRWHAVEGWRAIPVNLTGLATSAMMCLQLMTVILVSAVVRLTGAGTDLIDGLRGFGLPKLFVYSVDYTLAMLGGIRRKGMGGGMGGGRGRRAQAVQDAPGPGLIKVLKSLLRGDVGVFTAAVHDSLQRAQDHVQQAPGGKLESDLAHDVAVITGISFMMMSLKILKILPGIPFFSGFKTLLLYPLYFLAADLTRSRWGGTVCGTIMGVIGFLQGDGRYGAFEILKHTAPGIVIDLSWPLVRRLPRSMLVFCAVGFIAAIARTSTEFATVLLLRPRDEVLLFPFFKLIPNLIAGTLSGMVTYFVLPAFHATRAARQEADAAAEPAAAQPGPAPGMAMIAEAPAGESSVAPTATFGSSMGAGGGGGRGSGGGRGGGGGGGSGTGRAQGD